MSSFLERIEQPLMKVAGKLGQQSHLNAIRDGVVGALPLVLIGSLFLLIYNPPLGSDAALKAYTAIPWVSKLLIPVQILVKLITLYVTFGVAYSLAKRYNLDQLTAGLLAVAGLLLINGITAVQTIAPDVAATFTSTGAMQAESVKAAKEIVRPASFIHFGNLGPSGMFMGIILGLIVPEIQRFVRRYKLEIRMPDGVPPAVGRSFSALIPGIILLVSLWAIVHVAGVDMFGLVLKWLTYPIQQISQSGASVFIVLLIIILIDSILWLLGVHAVAILAPVAAVWAMNMTTNMNAIAAGNPAVILNTRETLVFFIWLGGAGATLVLPFLLLRAKATSLRAIAKVGLVPSIFNINEPLVFGVPIVMNVTLMIPFILAPIVTLCTTVLAMHFHLVPVPSAMVPWTLPSPIGAYLTTGYAWQAVVLSCVNIALAALIYWPFVRALDRKMVESETQAETEPAAV